MEGVHGKRRGRWVGGKAPPHHWQIMGIEASLDAVPRERTDKGTVMGATLEGLNLFTN